MFEICLKSVRTDWTHPRCVWHTSNCADGKNWTSASVLTCNIKHSGCFHTTPVSSPAFTPYHRDLQTTFPRPAAGEESAAGQRAEWMTSYSCKQTHSHSVSLSLGSLGSHRSLITSPALEQSLVACWLHKCTWTHMEDTHKHAKTVCICICAYVHRRTHKLHTNNYFRYEIIGWLNFFGLIVILSLY